VTAKRPLRLRFNPKIRLEFRGATITSDAELLAFREFDDALGLTRIAEDYLQESRTGRNIRHHLVPLLSQSLYSRLAGYDDTNDAQRLSQAPAMRVVVGWQGPERKGASTSQMGRFETETLTQKGNLRGLEGLNVEWVNRAITHTVHSRIILDIDSSVRYMASRKQQPTTATSNASATTRYFASTSLETVKGQCSDRATSTARIGGRNSSSFS
jgi:hypothetical protein